MNKLCSNCKKTITEHSEKEFHYCTKKIMDDLILAQDNHRKMMSGQKNSKSIN